MGQRVLPPDIEATTGGEQTIISVLNTWSFHARLGWKVQHRVLLMKILEDGAFLLDRAEDQHGTRFNISGGLPRTRSPPRSFHAGMDELFGHVIDDEDATGIPEELERSSNSEIIKR